MRYRSLDGMILLENIYNNGRFETRTKMKNDDIVAYYTYSTDY